MSDPLEALLVDRDEIDRAALAGALEGVLAVNRADGAPVQGPLYEGLSARQMVLAYFLWARAAVLLGLREDDALTGKMIEELSGLPGGTVRPKIGQLKDSRLIRAAGSGYEIVPSALKVAAQELVAGRGGKS